MRNEVVALLVIVVLMVSAAAGYFVGNSNRTTTTTVLAPTVTGSTATATQTVTLAFTSTITGAPKENASSDLILQSGLVLMLDINATRIVSGQAVEVSVTMFSPKSVPLNLTAAKGWPTNAWLFMPEGDSCGPQNYPVGMGIFQGYYTLANISSASPYALVRVNGSTPASTSCPVLYNIDHYWFYPTSDTALIDANQTILRIHGTYGLSGYEVIYTDEIPTRTASYPFQPGAYTIVAATEWSDMTLLHLVVL